MYLPPRAKASICCANLLACRADPLKGDATKGPLLHDIAVDQVFLDQTGDHVGVDVRIGDPRLAGLLNIYQGLLGAHPDAADCCHVGINVARF